MEEAGSQPYDMILCMIIIIKVNLIVMCDIQKACIIHMFLLRTVFDFLLKFQLQEYYWEYLKFIYLKWDIEISETSPLYKDYL